MGIGEKAVTARAVARHRKLVDLPLSARDGMGATPKVIPSDVVPSFTYGKKTRPSTPIASVVSYQFASEYEEDIGTKYEMDRQQKEYNAQIRKIPSTLAAKGHGKAAQKGQVDNTPKELFKISKFKRVQCKIEFPGGKTSEMKRLSSEPVEIPQEIQEGVEAQQAAQT